MQKLAEFIVGKRRAIFAVSLVLALVSALAMTQVTINKDLTRYMPADSNTLQGLDAMNAEFDETVPIRVMVEGLSQDEADAMAADLEALPDVSSVLTEQGADGTSGAGKTLFTVNLAGGTYSDSAKAGLDEVQGYCDARGLDAAVAGTVVDSVQQAKTLSLTIVFAVAMLLAILFVMCSSWVEPLLFLLTIAIAVLLNMGTNVIFPSISETTFSIAAVLQLALSMDYSIMLTDRYRQERLVEPDKGRAMVNALKTGFTAISASSVTTIAGMLCLVAMSFTIGRDLGLVLAKGVAFSVLCVLLVLPGLMVACDSAIQKTHKPHPAPKLAGLARFSHAWRYAVLAVFAVLMAVSFVVKGGTTITFFMDSSNPDEARINESFPATQQIVVLYDKDAPGMDAALEQIGALPGIDELQSYEGTIGKPLTVDEMADEMDMDTAVLKLLFHTYDAGTETGTLGVNELARLIADEVAGNPAFADALDAETLDQVETLATLSDPAELAEARTAAELAAVLGLPADQAGQLLLAYHIDAGDIETGPVSLPDFVAFLTEEVAGDPTYGALLDDEAQAQLERLAHLTDTDGVTQPLDAAGIAAALGMDESQVRQILSAQVLATADMSAYTLTLPQVLGALVDDVAADPAYAAYFDDATRAQLAQLRGVADVSAAGAELSADDLAALFGLDAATVQQLFGFAGMQAGGAAPAAMTVPAFLALLLDGVANNPAVAAFMDPALAEQLQAQADQLTYLRTVADTAAAGTALNPDDMAALLGMDATLMRQVYLACGLADGIFALPAMSVQSFLAYVLDVLMRDPAFQASVDQESLAGLYQARAIVDSSAVGTLFDAFGIAEVLGMDPDQVQQLLTLQAYLHGGKDSWSCNLATLVPFAADLVGDTDAAADGQAADLDGAALGQVDEDQRAQLQTAAAIVEGALAGTTYTADEMVALLGPLADGLSTSSVTLLYLLDEALTGYDPAQTLTLEQFVTYAADDVVGDAVFADVVDDTAKADLTDAKATLADAKTELVGATYARAIVETGYGRSSESMSDLTYAIRSVMDATGAEYYLVGDGPTGVEMRERFGDEFNFITALTAVVIFLIVALTFRSAAVPLVLVLLIQTAINLTMGLTALQGVGTYYIALMIVQALLMGATIDYAILFTTYYREARPTCAPAESLARAFRGSVGTIMTSSSILILVLFTVGFTSSDITMSEVCLTLAKGSVVAVTLVMLLLPGTLAALDRFVAGPNRLRERNM